MTPYQQFKLHWEDCRKCDLCKTRTKIVLARGQLPCDALCVAESPGKSEDVLGVPLIGPAGKLFDSIVAQAKRMADAQDLRIGYTNMICCIPIDEDGEKTKEPDDKHVQACARRLREFVLLADPKLIVCVGTVSTDYLVHRKNEMRKRQVRNDGHPMLGYWNGEMVSVMHPAAILRANSIQRDLMIKRCVVTIANGFKKLLES